LSETLVVCSDCASVNRLPTARPAGEAKCGKCSAKVFSAHPADVAGSVFDRHVQRSTLPVVVDIWAPWCGPCQAMAPAYEAAAKALEPEVVLIKLNSDNEPAISARLGIRGIPTMILFHRGAEVARTSGAMTSAQIVKWVRDRLPPVMA